MFDYLANDYNPSPWLVTDAPPPGPGRLQRAIPWSTSIVVDLPETALELVKSRSRKTWTEIARRERRFTEDIGPLQFRVVTDRAELAERLPEVQRLFAERWEGEFTSLAWKSEAGFAPYAEAMVDLASQGRAQLVLIDGDDRLLAFGYCLLEAPWCYFYQHAATADPKYRPYGLGKLLVSRLLMQLVERGDVRHVDLMLGDAEYKREWESWRRTVSLVLEERDTPAGQLRLASRSAWYRARHYAQFDNLALRGALKQSMRLVGAGR